MPAEHFADLLTITGGVAAASQSCLVDAPAAADAPRLAALAGGYLRSLDALPLLALAVHPGGACVGPSFAPCRLALLRFAPPYLAAARGGREIRYPILGGLLVRAPGGHFAAGIAPEGARARVWIDVVAFRPRLGLGPLYVLTQVQVHRLVTTAYLRRAARQAGW